MNAHVSGIVSFLCCGFLDQDDSDKVRQEEHSICKVSLANLALTV